MELDPTKVIDAYRAKVRTLTGPAAEEAAFDAALQQVRGDTLQAQVGELQQTIDAMADTAATPTADDDGDATPSD